MGAWYRHVALRCRRLSSRSPCHLLLLARSARFRPCEPVDRSGGGVCWGRHWAPVHRRHLQSTPQAAVGWGARVVLGVRLSLGHGRPRPRRCCPLVRPVPVIVVPHPRRLLPGPRRCCPRVPAPVSSSPSLLSSLSPYPPWVVISSSGQYLKKFINNK